MTDATPPAAVTQEEYRKTATIRASQWWQDGDHPAVIRKTAPNRHADEGIPWCPTLEGGHIVTPGDWIATGIQGEHWPIKPDVFAATYEPVSARLTASPPSTNGWREVLRECEVTFRFYERSHLEKGTQDGDEKAYRNHVMADKCAAVLDGSASPVERDESEGWEHRFREASDLLWRPAPPPSTEPATEVRA